MLRKRNGGTRWVRMKKSILFKNLTHFFMFLDRRVKYFMQEFKFFIEILLEIFRRQIFIPQTAAVELLMLNFPYMYK
jgi:hypothetical protein